MPPIKRPKDINILLACHHSEMLTQAFMSKGFNVTTADYYRSELTSNHHQGDLFDLDLSGFDMMFAFPPCTYLAKCQMFRYQKSQEIRDKRDLALQFFMRLYNSPVTRIVIENPPGYLSTGFRHPDQVIYPYWFGDPYSKPVGLWLKNAPFLVATYYNPVRRSVSNHVNSRMSQAVKSKIKSSWNHYPEMCRAFADQYGSWLVKDLNHQLA